MDGNATLIFLLFLLSFFCVLQSPSKLSHVTTLVCDLDVLNYLVNRKAIILICHAILLFVVRDSGVLSFSSKVTDDPAGEFSARRQENVQKIVQVVPVSEIAVEEEKIKEVIVEEKIEYEYSKRNGECLEVIVVEDKNEFLEGNCECLELVVVDEKEQGMEEELEDEFADEMNRRFEEFIEKVKRERRMEAALQLMKA